MSGVVVVDHAGDAQGADQCGLLARRCWWRRRSSRICEGVRVEGSFGVGVGGGDRNEIHPADGAFARMIGVNPRMHGAPVDQSLRLLPEALAGSKSAAARSRRRE